MENQVRTSKAAIWSLVLGIVGIFLFVPAIPAIILGIISLKKIKAAAGALKGEVLGIVGLALGCATPFFWLMILAISIPHFVTAKDIARKTQAKEELKILAATFELYEASNGSYPTTEQGFDAVKPYLEKAPVDPWGNKYKYTYPGSHPPYMFDLSSSGKDGIEGTEDDITIWKE